MGLDYVTIRGRVGWPDLAVFGLRWTNSAVGLYLNTLRPIQNGCNFTYDIFKCISLDENLSFQLNFTGICSLGFNLWALARVMAWHRSDDKPIPEPRMTQLAETCMRHPGPDSIWRWHPSYQYRKSHCGDKTVVRSSYLNSGISYTGEMTSLYWIRALVSICLTLTVFNSSQHGICLCFPCRFNSSSSGQNGHHFTDDIFRNIFVNEKLCILIKISLKFVPKFPIDNLRTLV